MKKPLLFLVIIYFWFLPPAHAEIKTFVHTVRQPFSGSQSPDDARVAATHKAKREVLEKAGTYLETLSTVEDGRLTKDQVLALASGILKTEIVSQEHYSTKEGFGINIKARVKVDTSVLGNKVKERLADPAVMRQLIDLRKKEKELLDKVELLEKKNQNLINNKETVRNKQDKRELQKAFQQATRGFGAILLNYYAISFWKHGKYSNPTKVIGILNEAIRLEPLYANSYGNRGNAYFNLKQYEKAVQDFNKSIELNPDNSDAYNNRGLMYIHLGQYAKAVRDFDKALKLNPNNEAVYNNIGLMYGKFEEYDKALLSINKSIRMGANNGEIFYNRGTIYVNLKQYEKAVQDFNKSIEFNPDNSDAYNNRGATQLSLTQYGSSGKSVGEFRFGEFSHREKQCDFKDFIASKAERFSRNEIYFAIQALNNA